MYQTKSARLHRLALGFLAFIFALHAQAACTFFDAFQDNKDGTVTDPRNGVIWKRCAEGFNWSGLACVGSSKEVSWVDAMKIAKQSRFNNQQDWRLPTRIEMEQVVGNHSDCQDNKYARGESAASNMIAHPLGNDEPFRVFWSSSSYAGYSIDAWYVNFSNGRFNKGAIRLGSMSVRLVRAGQSSAALEFGACQGSCRLIHAANC